MAGGWSERRRPGIRSKKNRSDVARCTLHVSGIQHQDFTVLNEIKGSANDKPSLLHRIRDKRLREAFDSRYRMEVVSSRIPYILSGVGLDLIGYH